MKSIYILTISILLSGHLLTQCPNDLCADAIEVLAWTPVSFCNTDCNLDWEQNGMLDNIEVGTGGIDCLANNADQWYYFDIPTNMDGTLTLTVGCGDCFNPSAVNTANYGRQEGWEMVVWSGADCQSAEIVWSTHCYWLTDQQGSYMNSYIGIGNYDPSRQEWAITFFGVPPGGRYYIQLDGLGWCYGCAVFEWMVWEWPLSIEIDTITTPVDEPVKKYDGRLYDVIGRRVR